jgi:hypothetical protein
MMSFLLHDALMKQLDEIHWLSIEKRDKFVFGLLMTHSSRFASAKTMKFTRLDIIGTRNFIT